MYSRRYRCAALVLAGVLVAPLAHAEPKHTGLNLALAVYGAAALADHITTNQGLPVGGKVEALMPGGERIQIEAVENTWGYSTLEAPWLTVVSASVDVATIVAAQRIGRRGGKWARVATVALLAGSSLRITAAVNNHRVNRTYKFYKNVAIAWSVLK